MNIQTLLSEIKQAKKRRVIFDYHPSPVSGVDVMAKDWKPSLVLLHGLFKSFKAKNCSITITWWGQIFITPENSNTAFELALGYKLVNVEMHDVHTLMREQDFIILRPATATPYYTVSLRAHRNSTTWKDISFNIGCDSAEKLATALHLDMLIKIKSYSNAGLQIEKVSLSDDDLLAALHYGAAKFGNNSQFYRISSVILNSMRRWEVELMENQITAQTQYPIKSRTFQLNDKEVMFLRSFLPPIVCKPECFKST